MKNGGYIPPFYGKRGDKGLKKGTIGIVCALCIMTTSLVQGICAAETQDQEVKIESLNTTMETACKLKNFKLYDDNFTAEKNVRYYKFTVKKMSHFDFNVNSDAKGEVSLLDSRGQVLTAWPLRGENLGFTYDEYSPIMTLIWNDDAYCVAEHENLEPGTYYVKVEADQEQFSEKTPEIRFHIMGRVQILHPYLSLKKASTVYTGKKIKLPKVRVTGKGKYNFDGSRVKFDCVIDRKTGEEVKTLRKVGRYLICNEGFLINRNTMLYFWGDNCIAFTVTPQKGVLKEAKSKKAGQIQAIAKKNTAAGRYQLQVSTDKKFKTNVQTVNTKETKQTVKNLESGKRYYVRVRYYKNVPIKYNHGMGKPQPIYGKWSKAKTVVCK